MTNDKAYALARKIDQTLTRALINEPLNKRSVHAWALVTRTVRSSLDILDAEIATLRQEGPKAPGRQSP